MFLRRAFAEGRHFIPRPSRYSHVAAAPAPPPLSTRATQSGNHDRQEQLNYVKRPVDSTLEFCKQVRALHSALTSPDEITRGPLRKFTRRLSGLTIPEDSSLMPQVDVLLSDVLLELCQSSKPRHHDDCRFLLRHVARLRRMSPTEYAEEIAVIIIQRGHLKDAFDWLSAMASFPEVRSTDPLPPWHRLLHAAAERRNEELIRVVFQKMDQLSIGPTAQTAQVVVQGFSREPTSPKSLLPPPRQKISRLIKLFRSYDLPRGALLIVGNHAQAQEGDLARSIERLYTAQPCEEEIHRLIASLPTIKLQKRYIKRCIEAGFQPTDATLATVMEDDFSLRNLVHWRQFLHVNGSAATCTKAMESLLEMGGLQRQEVVRFYRSETKDKVTPSSEMLHVALKALLSHGLQQPSDKAISEALWLYQDYAARCHQASSEEPSSDTAREPNAPGIPDPPSAKIYQLLLRALTPSIHAHERLPDVVALVEDMKRFGIRIDPQVAASVIIILMRSSTTSLEAFRIYRSIGRPADSSKPVLNEEGFAAVLHAFCTLDSWPNAIPSARMYFEIVSDMRKQNVPVTAKVYTVIISQLAKLATNACADPEEDEAENATAETLAKTLARVHKYLAVNPEFTPDTPLWNQLMDAYQRAGCFEEACRVWQKLFASAEFTNASVSIILDACAYRHAYDTAVRILTTLRDIGYPLNIRNWNTFLECLCRCDKLDEAMKVLCLEMAGRTDGVGPDIESVRILLKFAAEKNRESEVRSRVKRFLPKLYYSLPTNLRLG